MKTEKSRIIEETGQKYNEIIFEDDYIPKDIYIHQIRLRNANIDRALAGKKFKYVLDAGSGTGFHLKTLGKYSETVIATDFSMGALRESKKRFGCQFIVCDIRKLPFKPDTIDMIWVAGVLHHVPDDLDGVIRENLSVALKKDGLMLIDEPNKLNPLNHINMKLSKADPTGDERPLKLGEVTKLLCGNGLRILRYDYYGLFSPLGVLLGRGRPMALCKTIDDFIAASFLRIILFRWYLCAKKE